MYEFLRHSVPFDHLRLDGLAVRYAPGATWHSALGVKLHVFCQSLESVVVCRLLGDAGLNTLDKFDLRVLFVGVCFLETTFNL